jgi:F-type H+-transporting ATPase subunit c
MKVLKTALLASVFLALLTTVADAQPTTPAEALVASAGPAPFSNLRSIGVGLVIIGAAIGIGWLTRSAVESMARQPEIAGNIQTAMIISAALIEGVTFFALILIGFIILT